ncbi:sulfur oxidation c-type cytochrome SoxA [Gammaproteobacteria bacterium]|nr:sulfur oxidation c-type cytochrome SoxA [Gammaproteobacteria bacterium]
MLRGIFAIIFLIPALSVLASPERDFDKFVNYFKERFPNTPYEDYKNGVYSIDASAREQWEAMEEFPPYELNVDRGEELFNQAFKNGNTYGSCFENDGIGIRQNYPYFDTGRNKVVTLEGALNDCRVKNGEKPLSYFKGKELAHVSAYMAYTSRGNKFNVQIPNTSEALNAYEKGKKLYFTKKGQLNFSCADCHVYQTGTKLRADIPSPAIGHPTHFPVYRSGMGRLVTLHERFAGCLNRIRAKSFKGGSDELNNLEFFTTFMSNGLEVNGPGSRK